jgi:hypothetical protein
MKVTFYCGAYVRDGRFARLRIQGSDLNHDLRPRPVEELANGSCRRAKFRIQRKSAMIVGGASRRRMYPNDTKGINPVFPGQQARERHSNIAVPD